MFKTFDVTNNNWTCLKNAVLSVERLFVFDVHTYTLIYKVGTFHVQNIDNLIWLNEVVLK